MAFDALKKAITFAHVLTFPDYSKTFVIETDVSGSRIGAIIIQQGHPLAYISKGLSPKS